MVNYGADDGSVRRALYAGVERELPREALDAAPRIRFPRRDRPNGPTFEGRHHWVTAATFTVEDPAVVGATLDSTNLLRIEGPGCWWCGEAWSPAIGAHCSGPTE